MVGREYQSRDPLDRRSTVPLPRYGADCYGHRLIAALTDLLQRGVSAPMTIKARSPLASKYSGPDAALLQLQADAIALALEAFGTAPVQPTRAAAPARTR